MDFEKELDLALADFRATLIKKNRSYGNSVLDPVSYFSQASVLERLRVRMDDKVSRLTRGFEYDHEDTFFDLVGYHIMERIAKRNGAT